MPADVERTVEQRIVEAAAVLPSDAAITGWAALRWWGGTWFNGLRSDASERPVVLASCAQDIALQAGLLPCEERLDPREIAEVDGIRVVVPARAVFFEMRYTSRGEDAVIAFDMAAYADLVTMQEEHEYVEAHPGWTGVPHAREWLPRCDENSWSPWETRLRLTWEQTGLPRPLANVPVFDRHGRHVATPDLLDPEAGVAAEFDGALHLARAHRSRDLHRDQSMRDMGLETITFMSSDFVDLDALAVRLRAAYSRAGNRPRRWTIQPPDWWRPMLTVAQRRSLTGRLREQEIARRRRLAS